MRTTTPLEESAAAMQTRAASVLTRAARPWLDRAAAPTVASQGAGRDQSLIGDGQEVVLAAAVGWDGHAHDKYEQSLDLYLFGRPVSSYWEPIWQGKPLVLHDKQLVLATEYLGRCHEGEVMDLSEEINAILNNHPGPIAYFRVDSSTWKDARGQLISWVKILSNKRAEEVVIINLSHKSDLAFPIEDLQSPNLRCLRLAFLKIPDLDLFVFDYSSLRELQLLCCSYDGRRLSWVINDCASLQHLIIGFSVENLKISSKSLVTLQLLQCTASWLVIDSAPNLWLLATGVMPRRGYASVSISLNDTPSLKRFTYLLLPFHQVNDYIYLTSVENLRLGLNMATRAQRSGLRKILECLPMLSHLVIWRMDEVASDELIDVVLDGSFDDLNNVTCVGMRLRYFEIEDFRGGPAELNIVRSILRHAFHLVKLSTERCITRSREDFRKYCLKRNCEMKQRLQLTVFTIIN
ncbi:uncharacterized protein LOC133906803 [Phragmites australis]|uniref:uncharacterized protein LOC133906803 n=1 Tax=Phragmites australis TaxID=29695 RepID=UPI002D7907B3|nr:uncharacterized protein LOC133906803 [Phragmites australis]